MPRGRNKSRAKQRRYQFHVTSQVLAGMVNNPDGTWVTKGQSTSTEDAYKNSICGAAHRRV